MCVKILNSTFQLFNSLDIYFGTLEHVRFLYIKTH